MELKIINKNEQVLLGRTIVVGQIVFSGATPSNVDVQKFVAEQLKADPALVVIKHIYTHFGVNSADLTAYVYKSADAMKVEPKKKEKVVPGQEKPAETKGAKK